ncbi:hypothetical protein TRVL_07059 [Trypanosoma vivax]|uniref:Uncharacterized protein n=1 Tax=Trypanosoma vivax (strain Y486) TaxID=1055687 RepID=G0TRE6_TRYVY|nr:hypothetical protein TRVL_07059 [Trypanosoma vivax]CCC46510.1 conserved hypothetical protein [Trypanosoma vivax Y486]
MRCIDVLQTLMVRLVDPEKEEQDWTLLASLFYSLTKLRLPSQRVKQLYYQYLQSYGSRSAMEAACSGFEEELISRQRQRAESMHGPVMGPICAANIRSDTGSLVPPFSPKAGMLLQTPAVEGTAPMAVNICATGMGDSTPDRSGKPDSSCGFRAFIMDEHSRHDDGSEVDCLLSQGVGFSQLTAEQRERWCRLKHELISPDVLVELVRQFALVEKAEVFLSPVAESTVMEFNGTRSGPYFTVVRRPVSLMCMKRCVLAARRDYELHKQQWGALPTLLTAPQTSLPEAGNTNATASSSLSVATGLATRRRGRGDSVLQAPMESRPSSLSCGGPSTVQCTAEDSGAIRTLQELEQAVWHMAANCVVFNVPESFYPSTARRFATACIDIINQYCMQCILGV